MYREDLAQINKALREVLELGTDASRQELARQTPGQYDDIRLALDVVAKPPVAKPAMHTIITGVKEGRPIEEIASEVNLPVSYVKLMAGLQNEELTLEAFKEAVKKQKDKKEFGKKDKQGKEGGKPDFFKKGQESGDEDQEPGQEQGDEKFSKFKNFGKNGEEGEGDEDGDEGGDESLSDDEGDEEGEVIDLENPDDAVTVNPNLEDEKDENPDKKRDKPLQTKTFKGQGKDLDQGKHPATGQDDEDEDKVMNGDDEDEEPGEEDATTKRTGQKFDFLKKSKKKKKKIENGGEEEAVPNKKMSFLKTKKKGE